ncbi:ATP-dependent DNA helicase UvrD/PcrA [Halorhodospira halochloris]|uniref:DNA 3'-5' helicase n=1 Tax=Halorhodospira halochloris TaxID=1052 RepID=A0A110B4E1_HALHR|nr:DNA helicase II [Halorhodospira halochloris]MBK1650852.1 DNA helicase II [Halorhodospira halochloris]BAU56650.1 ATP-dependent DNA helicase UvrD/PcrA [Halorhodospira halochloris]
MDLDDLLSDLNDDQLRAVCVDAGRTLVLAGAGSGKTRVLTRRAAYLVAAQGASPFSILAVTFTNKAAGEMRGRIGSLLGIATAGMWVGTFHGIAHRLLRQHADRADLPEGFQILDSDDQLRMVKRILRSRGNDESNYPPRQVRNFISSRKDEGLRARDIESGNGDIADEMLAIYADYEQACQRAGMVDFGELLLRAYELLRFDQELLEHYRRRFQHILVDELQDTNSLQYRWLKLIAGPNSEVFAVGDDDQSIYGWRGARVENIERYCREMGDVAVVRLEQNYRSTATILSAANDLIACNASRLGKNLWTQGASGEPITLYSAFNEVDEARWVVERIRAQIQEGDYHAGDFAILYRSNAQSRAFEEALVAQRIPYRVYGGLRFFERAEIKDALAYLRLTINRHDDSSFERAVATPPRGIGAKTMEIVRSYARESAQSLWSATRDLIVTQSISGRARNALISFINLLDELEDRVKEQPLHHQVEHAISSTGLRNHHSRDESRLENLDELVTAARSFVQQSDENIETDQHPLISFLTHAALEAGEAQADDWQRSVQLMTLHAAKGLEFPVVFLAGMEEGLFPHYLSREDSARLEEERRLCYVGMTRARQRLLLTHAQRRRLHGRDQMTSPSRFLSEIPDRYIELIRPHMRVSRNDGLRDSGDTRQASVSPVSPKFSDEPPEGFSIGSRVRHSKFGEGVIMSSEGRGDNARLQVRFDGGDTKWLVAGFAKLEVMN